MAQQAQNIIKAIEQMVTSTPDVETLRESLSRSGSLSNKSTQNTTQDSSSLAKSVVHSKQQPPAASVFQSNDPYILTQAQSSKQPEQQNQHPNTAPAPSIVQPAATSQPYKSSMLKSTPELAKPASQTAAQPNFQSPQALSMQNPTRSQTPNTIAQQAIENNIIRRFSTELAPRLIQEITNNIKKDLQKPAFSNDVATMPSHISQYTMDNNTSMIGNRSQLSQIETQNQILRIKQLKRNIANIRTKMTQPWLTRDECYDIVSEIFKYRK